MRSVPILVWCTSLACSAAGDASPTSSTLAVVTPSQVASSGSYDAPPPSSESLFVLPGPDFPTVARTTKASAATPTPTKTDQVPTDPAFCYDALFTKIWKGLTNLTAMDDTTLAEFSDCYRHSPKWPADTRTFMDLQIETFRLRNCSDADTVLSDSPTPCGDRGIRVLHGWRGYAQPYEHSLRNRLEERARIKFLLEQVFHADAGAAKRSTGGDADDVPDAGDIEAATAPPSPDAGPSGSRELSAWIRKFLVVLRTLRVTQETGQGQNTSIAEVDLVLSQFVAAHSQSDAPSAERRRRRSMLLAGGASSRKDVRAEDDGAVPEGYAPGGEEPVRVCLARATKNTFHPTAPGVPSKSLVASTTFTLEGTTITMFMPASTPEYVTTRSSSHHSGRASSPTTASPASAAASGHDGTYEAARRDDVDASESLRAGGPEVRGLAVRQTDSASFLRGGGGGGSTEGGGEGGSLGTSGEGGGTSGEGSG